MRNPDAASGNDGRGAAPKGTTRDEAVPDRATLDDANRDDTAPNEGIQDRPTPDQPRPVPPVTPPDEATRAQQGAADPGRSTWLTANAGSGKTSVLTDRVARLLLAGTRPERILCLTYTKAAATEMQNRLLTRLGGWAMLDDAALTARLHAMGAAGADTHPPPDLAAARRLFAQAIEAPGGLKVQTIHSFCAGVLRRFPLEAGVPHGFAELDDRSAARLRATIIEDMAAARSPEMEDLLLLHGGDGLDRFLSGLRDFDAPPDAAALWHACGLAPGDDDAVLLDACFGAAQGQVIAALIPHLQAGGTSDIAAATKLLAGNWETPGRAELELLESVLLFGASAKAPFGAKIGHFPTKALRAGSCGPLLDRLDALMSLVEAARPKRVQLDHARRTLALHRFGHVFCRRYTAAKQAGGWLDFDDLIARTARLLDRSDMAQWVLFRLDGGIDHILVDEAQDTSPLQWQVVRQLTAEFAAGIGAARGTRTLFVVGDMKQSIYSFQGADTAIFTARRAEFAEGFAAAGDPMQDAALRHSFRSSPAILSVTDATFDDPDAITALGEEARHIAFRDAMPGRVDLWPLVAEPEAPEETPWHSPVDQAVENSAAHRLADQVALACREMLGQPAPRRDGSVRPIAAGDILILVQRRSVLFHDIIRALKQAGLPVAGADRLHLGAELAVQDIRAVLSVLALREDDLSLAAALRSPLFGLSEDDLYRLAAPRRGLLVEALRTSPHDEARAVLRDLAAQADYLRPYDLISRLLVRHGGRARLIARLGPEAEDGIDELLAQALVYENAETPSLTGFLVWLAGDDIEVRRQPGSAEGEGGGMIRVMTVHGAKGLESPVVILPDSGTRRPPQAAPTVLPDQGPPAHWRGTRDTRPAMVRDWAERDERRQAEERLRLLYVAMTRAESWLIVAAAGKPPSPDGAGDSWHARVAAGFDRAKGLTESALPAPEGGSIRRLSWGDWPVAAAGDADAAPAAAPPDPPFNEAPGWARRPPDRIPRPPTPIAATALGGDKVLTGTGGAATGGTATGGAGIGAVADGREAALLAGTRLHLLLEHLPDAPRADWSDLARTLLSDGEHGMIDDAALAALLDDIAALVDAEALAPVFSPAGTVLREVELTAPLPGGRPLWGIVDRLIVAPDRVTVIDYKSNAEVPDSPAETPSGYLRQMAAYAQAARAIWPGRAIECAILWTARARLMTLPHALLDHAWAEAMAGLER